MPTDVSDPGSVENLVARAGELGPIAVLHANAGIGIYDDLERMPVEMITRLIAVNLTGMLLCCRAVIAPMRAAGGGAIVITSSIQANLSLPGCVAYSATKAGAIAAARTLAVEVGGANIRVNCVSPGTIETPMLERDLAGMDRDGGGTGAAEALAGFRQRVESANALGRIGTAEEVAQGGRVPRLGSGELHHRGEPGRRRRLQRGQGLLIPSPVTIGSVGTPIAWPAWPGTTGCTVNPQL